MIRFLLAITLWSGLAYLPFWIVDQLLLESCWILLLTVFCCIWSVFSLGIALQICGFPVFKNDKLQQIIKNIDAKTIIIIVLSLCLVFLGIFTFSTYQEKERYHKKFKKALTEIEKIKDISTKREIYMELRNMRLEAERDSLEARKDYLDSTLDMIKEENKYDPLRNSYEDLQYKRHKINQHIEDANILGY